MMDWSRHPILNAKRPPRKIAVLRALHLGDLLLAVPALRAMRTGFPSAEITLIGLPWAQTFARRFSHYVDRFVVFPGFPGIIESDVVPERTAKFIGEQRAYAYDLVVQMHGSGRISNRIALALGGAVTAGYYEKTSPQGLSVGAHYPSDQPEIVRNLGLARLLGCPNRTIKLEFPLSQEDRSEAAALLRQLNPSRPVVALHPGSRSPSRRWPSEYFAMAADAFARRYDAQILLTGGHDEVDAARRVRDHMVSEPLDLAGKTSLGGLAAIIERLDLFVSNDTGPAHMADALGTPSVTLFGPADPRRWAPLDRSLHPIVRWPVECSPCPHWECPIDHRCLRLLSPDVVVDVAARLLGEGAAVCNA